MTPTPTPTLAAPLARPVVRQLLLAFDSTAEYLLVTHYCRNHAGITITPHPDGLPFRRGMLVNFTVDQDADAFKKFFAGILR